MNTKQTSGIFTTDTDLAIRSWDSWLAGATGMSADSVRGMILFEIFPEQDNEAVRAVFRQVLTDGVATMLPKDIPYLIPCPPQNGSRHFDLMRQQVMIAPLREEKRIVGTIVTLEDITATLEQEIELQELRAHLHSTDENIRLQAARTIVENPRIPRTPLLDILGDDSWQVRRMAVEGLAADGSPQTIDFLIEIIRYHHQDLNILNSALQILARIDSDVVAPLAELLQSPDVDLRGYVVLALGEQRDARAIPHLMAALEDEDQNVRYYAIEGLGKFAADEATGSLLNIVESGDFFLAFPALEALKRIGNPSVAARLKPLLADPVLRESCVEVLGELGDENIAAPLAAMLDQKDAPVPALARALITLHDRYTEWYDEGDKISVKARAHITENGVHHLVAALDNAAEEDLSILVRLLSWFDGMGIERALAQLLGHDSVRKEVVKSLVRYGEKVSDLLLEQLKKEENATRLAAIIALGRIGGDKAAPAIIGLLREIQDEQLLISAINALEKIGATDAFDALVDRLEHPSPAVRQAVISALSALEHPEMPARMRHLLHHAHPHVREAAVRITGYFAYPDALSLLLMCCHDRDEQVREAALESLPNYSAPEVIPALAHALRHDTPKARAAAARGFAGEGTETAEYLLAALTDENEEVRYYAVRSLGRQKAEIAPKLLTGLITGDPVSQVRIAAIEALGYIGAPQTVSVLQPLTGSENPEIARAAMNALGESRHAGALSPLLAALEQPSPPQAKRDALRALRKRCEPAVVQALRTFITTERDQAIVREAIDILARLAIPEAIATLVDLSAETGLRKACVSALSRLDPATYCPAIAAGLQHAHPRVRIAVVEILDRMHHLEAHRHLLTALQDPNTSVRLSAVFALSKMHHEETIRALRQAASSDSNAAVRRAARNAVERYGQSIKEG